MKSPALLISAIITVSTTLSPVLLSQSPHVDPLLSGFDLSARTIHGGHPVRISDQPIWVKTYSQLDLTYRTQGTAPSGTVLSLRPGSVGPVTPRANNPENPFANGTIVPVISAADLIADGKQHHIAIDLAGKIRTAQIDQLIFTLPANASLKVSQLSFVARSAELPCYTWAHAAPVVDAIPLTFTGPLHCSRAAATSLRGREAIHIGAPHAHGSAVYLSMLFYSPALSNYVASQPAVSAGTSDPSLAIVRIHYSDGIEEQFPMELASKRHILRNGAPGLYAIALNPKRKLLSLEIQDESPHVQLFLFGAGITDQALPQAVDETVIDEPAVSPAKPLLLIDPPYKITANNNQSVDGLKPDLHVEDSGPNKKLSLSIRNTNEKPLDLTIAFPSQIVKSQDNQALYYLFPQRVARISADPVTFSADYGPDFLLQFLDVFSPADNSGIAFLVDDTAGKDKTFALSKRDNEIHVSVLYSVHLEPGETFSPPAVELIPHTGDWHAGFDAYRRWVASWYSPRGSPQLWLKSSFYARRDYPVGGSDLLFDQAANKYSFDKLIADGQAAFGGIDLIDISGWALSDKFGRVGDYPIELGSPEDLRSNIAFAHQKGIRTGLYFEGYLVDKDSRIGSEKGADWQIRDADGKRLWWPGGSPEMFLSPYVPEWRSYLAHRMASVAQQVGADAVYLDEFGCGKRRDYASAHEAVGSTMIHGEIEMAKDVRSALDHTGQSNTVVYAECLPVDVAAPYYDALFSYAIPSSDDAAYDVKLNLWRFTFPGIRIWDMLTAGVEPHLLSAEDFRLAAWQGDGVWLKGRTETWYGDDILHLLRKQRPFFLRHAAAFAGKADPLIPTPDDRILINRFSATGDTVYTIFNRSYGTVAFSFLGQDRKLGPRAVAFIAAADTGIGSH